MNLSYPTPIRQENFQDIWTFTDQHRRTAKKKFVTARVAPFFSNLTFCILLFFAALGLIHDHIPGKVAAFLGTVPKWLPLWNRFRAVMPGLEPVCAGFVVLLSVYVISFGVCCIFVLLVGILYHPLKQKLPEASPQENAQQLLAMARNTRRYAFGTDVCGSITSAFLFSLGALAFLGVYWIGYLKEMQPIAEAFTSPVMRVLKPCIPDQSIYESIQMNLFPGSIMVAWAGLYIGYMLLNRLHGLSIRFLFRYPVPYSFVAQIEEYAVFCGEETADLTQEALRARHREQAEAKRIQALELESHGAYPKAKALLAEAAHGGDVPAMEHYARHWLMAKVRDPARFWLERAIATGQASEEAQKLLKRIKWHRRIDAKHLKKLP